MKAVESKIQFGMLNTGAIMLNKKVSVFIFTFVAIGAAGFGLHQLDRLNSLEQVSQKQNLIGFNEGQFAPDFEIEQINGESFKLSDFRGEQSVYVIFWNTWCSYCIKKIPKQKQVQETLGNQIRIIAINTSRKDSVEETLEFKDKFQINYPIAFDHGEVVTDLYDVWGTPTEFIIDINGKIQHRDNIPNNIKDKLSIWNTL